LRILLLSYDVSRRGGIERLTLQVREALNQHGVLVTLLCPRPRGPGLLGRWLGRLGFLLALGFWLPRCHTVVSMHALLLPPLRWLEPLRWLAGPWGRRARRQRRLCWLHGIEVWGDALPGVRDDLCRCDGLLASSRFTRDRVLERPGRWPPIRVVHPMANLMGEEAPLTPPPWPPVLLTVSRMASNERYKGHRLVLAALALLRSRGQLPAGLRWHVVGEGDDRPALERECAALGLQPWVRFLGGLGDGELVDALRGCSLLLLPSAYAARPGCRAEGEGFGIVYLEAAWAGRPSIGCREGGQSDLILDGETGWLIEPDPAALAELLAAVLARPHTLASTGARARARAEAHFDLERFASELRRAILPSGGA
jgi:glycosyltransferase involved in cell wall biosynthesis